MISWGQFLSCNQQFSEGVVPKLVLLDVLGSHLLSNGLWLMSMAWAPPDIPGLMEIFPTVAEMLILEGLKVLIQWRLSPAEGPVSFVVIVM